VGELQVALGLPMTFARLTHAVLPAEVAFGLLSLGALALLWRLRTLETELAISVALGLALVIGLHVLGYDMMFLAPLGMWVAQRHPWPVFAMGWVFSMAQIVDEWTRWASDYVTPLRMAELAPLVAVAAAVAAVWRTLEDTGEQGGGAALVAAVPRQSAQQHLLLPHGPVALQPAQDQPGHDRGGGARGNGQPGR
jgi:hypothetical protein